MDDDQIHDTDTDALLTRLGEINTERDAITREIDRRVTAATRPERARARDRAETAAVQLVATLDDLGVPENATVRETRRLLRLAGVKVGQEATLRATQIRKNRARHRWHALTQQ